MTSDGLSGAVKVTLVRSRAIDPGVFKMADTLYKKGYGVKLLVWDRSGDQKPPVDYKVDRYQRRAPYDQFSAVLRYLPLWMAHEFFYLLKDDSEIIHACDLETLIPAIPVKILKRKRLSYIIYDFTADNIPHGMPSALKRFTAWAEKFAIRFSDVLFLVDECRYRQVAGAKIKSLYYLYNSPPERIAGDAPVKKNSVTTIFYAGVLHRSRGIEYMVRALSGFDDVRLVLAGTGPCREFLDSLPEDLKKKVEYIGQIPYEQVICQSLEADILFAFYDPAIPNNRYASPNKLFESMMCSKPIIINDGIAAADIVRKEGCGLVVPYGDVEALAEKISALKSDSEYRSRLGKNGRAAYDKKYSWSIMEGRLLEAFHNLSQ